MKRIKLIIQYLGTNYAGWQVQPKHVTVQGMLERAIVDGLGESAEVHGSGRTDAGVHAFAACAHFDTASVINPNKIYAVLNRFLPTDIRVLSSEQVEQNFHARFSAVEKTYEYRFYVSPINMPLLDITHARVGYDFDFDQALAACQAFLGTHDFRGFCSSGSQTKDTFRTISEIALSAGRDNTFCLSVTGNGFLYNMVRIIAGTIIEVGCGKISAADMAEIIASGDRNRAGKTAQPCGLALREVRY